MVFFPSNVALSTFLLLVFCFDVGVLGVPSGGLIALFEFIAGSYFTSAKKYIDEVLLSIRLIAADAGLDSGGSYYYEVLEKSFATLWKTAFVLTAIRGTFSLEDPELVPGFELASDWRFLASSTHLFRP